MSEAEKIILGKDGEKQGTKDEGEDEDENCIPDY